MTRILIALCLPLLLSACAGFTLGSFNYCAKDSECANSVRPFRSVAAVQSAGPGASGATALPVVKAP